MCLKNGKNSVAPARGEPIQKAIDDRNEPQISKSGLFDKVGNLQFRSYEYVNDLCTPIKENSLFLYQYISIIEKLIR